MLLCRPQAAVFNTTTSPLGAAVASQVPRRPPRALPQGLLLRSCGSFGFLFLSFSMFHSRKDSSPFVVHLFFAFFVWHLWEGNYRKIEQTNRFGASRGRIRSSCSTARTFRSSCRPRWFLPMKYLLLACTVVSCVLQLMKCVLPLCNADSRRTADCTDCCAVASAPEGCWTCERWLRQLLFPNVCY